VRAALPWVPVEIWTSPATRCAKLAASLGIANVRVEPRLAELFMGTWEGQRWDDVRGRESEAWFADPWRARPPGGETAPELLARVAAVREELRALDADRIALVTHAGVIRAWHSLAESQSLADAFRQPVPFGSITAAG
jgi:alpha-ribazole phosphatase